MDDITLFEYQDAGVQWLLNHTHGILGWQVGTGKTLTAITALNTLPRGSVLIVSPKRVQESMWRLLDYPINHEVTFINYELLPYRELRPTYDYIILDEVHKIKGQSTKSAKLIQKLCKHAKRVWGLSGTVAGNDYLDVFRILKHMNVEECQYPDNSFIARYYMTYQIPVQTRYGCKLIQKPYAVRSCFEPELMGMFAKYCSSLTMDEVQKLPAKHESIEYVDGMVTEEYKLAEDGVIKLSDDNISVVAKLEAINKAHQAALGFLYWLDPMTGTMHTKPLFEKNPKIERLRQMLITRADENIIIAYKYKYDKKQIETMLQEIGREYTDDVSQLDDCSVLLLQFSCGVGLNLQYFAHTIIMYSFDYSYLSYNQYCGRVYRVGQTYETNIILMVSTKTVEEKIYAAIMTKQSLDDFLKESTKLAWR